MSTTYTHLNHQERAVIQAARDRGASIRSIALRLHRHPSTISREIARCGRASTYDAKVAHANYVTRRKSCVKHRKLLEGNYLFGYVRDRPASLGLLTSTNRCQAQTRVSGMYPDQPHKHVNYSDLKEQLSILKQWVESIYTLLSRTALKSLTTFGVSTIQTCFTTIH